VELVQAGQDPDPAAAGRRRRSTRCGCLAAAVGLRAALVAAAVEGLQADAARRQRAAARPGRARLVRGEARDLVRGGAGGGRRLSAAAAEGIVVVVVVVVLLAVVVILLLAIVEGEAVEEAAGSFHAAALRLEQRILLLLLVGVFFVRVVSAVILTLPELGAVTAVVGAIFLARARTLGESQGFLAMRTCTVLE
jgi:hypothetical protein